MNGKRITLLSQMLFTLLILWIFWTGFNSKLHPFWPDSIMIVLMTQVLDTVKQVTTNDLCFHDTTSAIAASSTALMATTTASPPAGSVAWPPSTLFLLFPALETASVTLMLGRCRSNPKHIVLLRRLCGFYAEKSVVKKESIKSNLRLLTSKI